MKTNGRYDSSDEKAAVREIQRCLGEVATSVPGISPVFPDGEFGKATQTNVTAFQSAKGLPATGTVDRETWDALFAEREKCGKNRSFDTVFPVFLPLTIGSRGVSVSLLQSVINYLCDFYPTLRPIAVTGDYRSPTGYAVSVLQRKYRLPETGVTDRETWERIIGDYTAREKLSLFGNP